MALFGLFIYFYRVIHPVLKVYLKSSKLVPLGWNFMKIGDLRQLPFQTALMLQMTMIYRFFLRSLCENCKVVLGCISEIFTQVNFQRTVTTLATTWFILQSKSFQLMDSPIRKLSAVFWSSPPRIFRTMVGGKGQSVIISRVFKKKNLNLN